MNRESDLYLPLKAFFTARGYEVKGEVGPADLVARRGDETVVVELKLGFSLALFHQAMDRLAICDEVYVAVPAGGRAKAFAANLRLARRIGVGVLSVRARDGFVEVHADPGGYVPRRSPRKAARLKTAFDRLRGDPNAGGATRHGLVTGYRQDAVVCARFLAARGPSRGAQIKAGAGVPAATAILAANHYGWFRRVSRGVYDLTENGRRALADWGDL